MRKLSQEEFINECNKKHNFKFDYTNVKYINAKEKISIICPKHGEFKQRPNEHKNGQGCHNCYNEIRSELQLSNINNFIEKSTTKHGNKFDYSRSVYINSLTKIEIICKKHGVFYQIPGSHWTFEEPCPSCRRIQKDEIMKSFNLKHNNKYDYSISLFDNKTTTKSYINIICKKHGVFKQRINHHIDGTGCPKCKESQGEKTICEILCEIGLTYNIDFFREKTFKNLIFENNLFFDFFLPKYNLCIEFDGDQHFKPIKIFGGQKTYEKIIIRDSIKNEYCLKNNIHLLRFNKKYKREDIKRFISSIIKN